MSLTRLSVRRPVAVAMLFLAVVMLGLLSFARLPIDLLPDVSYPRIVVFTSYPDVSPAEIERLITERVEGAVATTPLAERVTSISREGMSLVTLRLAWGTDMDFAMLNVRERLDNLRTVLPPTAARPQILRVDPESDPIMVLSVAGDDLWETKEMAENVFRRRLEQLDGIAQAVVAGGMEREIVVEVDPERLESYGLSIADVALALDQANQAAPGGTILEGRTRYPFRTLGEFRTIAEIEDVIVGQERTTSGTASTIRVSDLAAVRYQMAERTSLARYNGQEAVGLMVFKEAGANTVEVARTVEEVLAALRVEFPGISVDVAQSQAGFISDSIRNVVSNLVVGGILASLVLFLFLRRPRYPVAVALSIPISVVGTFALMDVSGVSLNIMSLGGLALGVGMLVDNSIIVLENIFRHRDKGVTGLDGAARGAEEVSGAITASTLTTIAVFLPIVYVEGVAGELFRDLSLAVAFSLLASLLVALTLLPTMAARFTIGGVPETPAPRPLWPGPRRAGFFRSAFWLTRTAARLPVWALSWVRALSIELVRFWWGGVGSGIAAVFRRPLAAFDRAFERFARRYEAALEWSLDRRAFVLGAAGTALAGALALGLTLERDLLPGVDQGTFEVELELPAGTALQRTDEVAAELERILMGDPDVDAVFGTVGQDVRRFVASEDASGLHTARLQVRLRDGADAEPVVERHRAALQAKVPDGVVTVLTGQVTQLGQLLGGVDADIAVRLRAEELDVAFDHADRLVERLSGLARLVNVRVGAERGHPQFEVQLLREDIARFGLAPQAVADAVEHGMRGSLATEFVEFDRKVPVVVRLADDLRYDIRTLERLQVAGVPLSEVLDIRLTEGPSEIRREDQGRVVAVLADVREGGLDQAILEVQEVIDAEPPPPGVQIEVGGENEEMSRSFRDLALAFGLAVLLVYMILAAQFESFLHPGTILAAVPLSLIGAILGLFVAGQGVNTMSLIGLVILVGIVANDSIVKVDFIVQARARGAGVRDAIMEAGRVRLRPIIMTTATTILGLTPMMLGIGRGAELRSALAVTVIGGLAVATLLTLIIVPVIFSVVEDVRLALAGASEAGPDAGAGGSSGPAAPDRPAGMPEADA